MKDAQRRYFRMQVAGAPELSAEQWQRVVGEAERRFQAAWQAMVNCGFNAVSPAYSATSMDALVLVAASTLLAVEGELTYLQLLVDRLKDLALSEDVDAARRERIEAKLCEVVASVDRAIGRRGRT